VEAPPAEIKRRACLASGRTDDYIRPVRAKRASLAPAALLVLTSACAAHPTGPAVEALPKPPPAVAFLEDPAPLPRYHSKRLGLSLPLPSGKDWSIDDHSRPELVLRHDPTRSTVVAAILRADELVGRTQCEALARESHLLPQEDLRLLEDEIALTQGNYDTRIRVGVAPGARPDAPIVGYVVAVGGFLRKCYVFVFATSIDRAADEPVLSSRLAFARARILGGLELDAFATVPRDRPGGAALP
jgi:hypothetical protein